VPMTSEQAMGFTSQVVSVLASTMSSSTTTAIFADNYFTNLEIVWYLKDKNCRYTGTARDDKIGKPPLKDMEKNYVPRDIYDYDTSDAGILALRWKDNRTWGTAVTTRERNSKLCHLYRTPMKFKRWYMRMFAYAIDLCLMNTWIMYRRDIKALAVDGLSLKNFRTEVGQSYLTPKRALLIHTPNNSVRFDVSLFHAPVYTKWQTSNYCSRKGKHIEVKHGVQGL
ncbi:hypothetical protein M9458_008759, partial [Cirrhinus mrigala]